jgi:hypothetical protein
MGVGIDEFGLCGWYWQDGVGCQVVGETYKDDRSKWVVPGGVSCLNEMREEHIHPHGQRKGKQHSILSYKS